MTACVFHTACANIWRGKTLRARWWGLKAIAMYCRLAAKYPDAPDRALAFWNALEWVQTPIQPPTPTPPPAADAAEPIAPAPETG
jgi:hypothetical protein